MSQTKAEKEAAKKAKEEARAALEKDATALGVKFTKKTTNEKLAELIKAANGGEGTPATGAAAAGPEPKGDGPVDGETEDGKSAGKRTGKFYSDGNRIFNPQGVLVGTEENERVAARKADRFNDLERNRK